MPLPRFIDLHGRRYLWRDLIALRHAQAVPSPGQPTLFELREDHRLPGERNPAERYREPNLFTLLEQSDRDPKKRPAASPRQAPFP